MAENEIKEEEQKAVAAEESREEGMQEEKAYLDSKIDDLQDRMNSMDTGKRKKVFAICFAGVFLFIVAKLLIGVHCSGRGEEKAAAPASSASPAVAAERDSADIILDALLNDEEVLRDPAVDSALNIIMKK